MSAFITTPGATFVAGARVIPADPVGLVGLYVLGAGLAGACINHAGGAAAGILGLPIANEGYLTIKSGTNYLNSHIVDTQQSTSIVISRHITEVVSGATAADLISNLGTNDGVGLYGSTTGARGSVWKTNSAYVTNGPIAGFLTTWTTMSLSVSASLATITDWTNSITDADALNAPHLPSANPILIGSGYAGSGRSGSADVAVTAHYAVHKTQEQIAAIIPQLIALAEANGVVFP